MSIPMNQSSVHKSILVPASCELVWKKWTTSQGLKSFIGVDNLVELVPGGPYEIYFLMDNPPGLRGGEGNKVLSFLPHQMLSFTWNAPPSIPEVRNHDHKTWVVIQMESLGNSETQVTLDHLGWLDGHAWDETRQYFENAWDVVFSALIESCSAE